jgi:AcrR family transcriptional regulator
MKNHLDKERTLALAKNGSVTEGSGDRILDAAFTVMCARGFAGTAISAVERLSGFPASSIYYHFGSKEGLGAALVQREAKRWLGDLRKVDAETASPDSQVQIREHMARVLRLLDERPEFLRLLMLLTFEHANLRDDTLEVIRGIRLEAQAFLFNIFCDILTPAGEKSAVLARRLTRLTIALIEGIFVQSQVTEDFKMADLLDEVVISIEAILGAYLNGVVPPLDREAGAGRL